MILGFPQQFINLIMDAISQPEIGILLDGAVYDSFIPSRGIRQGDPLSPFLFNIAVEGLNELLSRANDANLIKGTKLGGQGH